MIFFKKLYISRKKSSQASTGAIFANFSGKIHIFEMKQKQTHKKYELKYFED